MYHFTQGTLSLAFRNNDSQVTTLQEEDELPCLTLWQLKLLSKPLQPMRVNWHHVNFYAHITLLEAVYFNCCTAKQPLHQKLTHQNYSVIIS